jgi:AcrR family transcriptional regulator
MAARAYTSSAREDAAQSTRVHILDAAIALAYETGRVDVPLDRVAERAGRSVQTILRHFGSRDGMIEAAVQRGIAEAVDERRPPPDDVPGALRLLVEHYERRGAFMLRLLALGAEGDAESATQPGRLLHRAWVEEVFADEIAASRDAAALTDTLVVATDLYTWKLLRLDRGLPAATVCSRMATMVSALTRHAAEETE